MLWWVVETTVVAVVLAAVAALVPRLRPLGPAARHTLWLVVLIKLVTPPLLSWPWPVAVWAWPQHDRGSIVPAGDTLPDQEPAAAVDEDPGTVDLAAAAAEVDAPGPDPGDLGPHETPAAARTLGRGVLGAWLILSAALAAGQVGRIVRFRRRLRGAVPAPAWVAEEAARVGERLGVRVPEALAVAGLGVPMLWCLGRPKLLLPSKLVATLGVERWRCVLAHELAHVRRRDPWVGRLALVAGWLWWWNPLYWLARRRLDAEAELACDAWVVWALPDDRFVYAETLLDVSASLSHSVEFPTVRVPSPALGVAVTGAGRFFERRLTMILRDQVPCRLSLPALLGAGLLSLAALPSWTVAEPPGARTTVAVDAAATTPADVLIAEDVAVTVDQDDDDPPATTRRAPRAARSRSRSETETASSPSPRIGKKRLDLLLELSDLEKIGPEIEEALKEELGPGSEFEEALKGKLGPGSEFEKKMKEVGRRIEKEITEKFGPGSEFEEAMKELSERAGKATTAPDSEEEPEGPLREKNKPKVKTRPSAAARPRVPPVPPVPPAAPAASAASAPPAPPAAPSLPSPRRAARTVRASREQRIKELESKVDQLLEELQQLKEDGRDDEEPR